MNAAVPVMPNVAVYLMVADGPRQGSLIPVRGPQFLIGRHARCNLRPSSNSVGELHCGVLAREGRHFLCDLNSAEGTYLNDRQIVGEVELLDADRLRVGPLQFVVRILPGVAMPTPEQAAPPAPEFTQELPVEETVDLTTAEEPNEEVELVADDSAPIPMDTPLETPVEEALAPVETPAAPEPVAVAENPARMARALLRKYSARRR